MLAESKDPLIIDQPEDALDIATIYKDLVTPVKERKIQRQFIFSSHNSALVVGGDSDKSFILDAKAKRGRSPSALATCPHERLVSSHEFSAAATLAGIFLTGTRSA